MIDVNKKFNCKKCGRCCNNSLNKDKGNSYGLIFLPHEADSLKEKLKSLKKQDKIVPVSVFYDEISKKGIVLMYELDDSNCPFQENNECSIYNERASICKIFPLAASSVNNVLSIGQSSVCPGIDTRKEEGKLYDREELYKKILSFYPKEMLSEIFFFDNFCSSITSLMDELEKKGEIKNSNERKDWELVSLSSVLGKNRYNSILSSCRKQAEQIVEKYD